MLHLFYSDTELRKDQVLLDLLNTKFKLFILSTFIHLLKVVAQGARLLAYFGFVGCNVGFRFT